MITKTYKAKNFAEAIEKIRAELGPKATIVSTRKVAGTKTFFKSEPAHLEITAQVDDSQFTQREIDKIKGRTAGTKKTETQSSQFASVFEPFEKVMKSDAQSMFKTSVDVEQLVLPSVMQKQEQQSKLVEENERLKQQIQDMRSSLSQLKTENQNFIKKYAEPKEDLDECRKSIKNLLMAKGVGTDLIQKWTESSLAKVADATNFDTILDHCVEFFMEQFKIYDGKLPRVMSFCGPAGSGKSTTVMKLAKYLTKKDKRVLVVSMDPAVGSVEQYRMFALESLVRVNFVTQNLSLRKIVTEAREIDHILIDTCSYALSDIGSIFNLQRELNAVGSFNYLVFSAREIDASKFMKAYSEMNFYGTIFCKLDESNSPGPVLNHIYHSGLPVLYYGIGKNLDEDLEVATSERIVSMLLNVDDYESEYDRWKPRHHSGPFYQTTV